MGTQSGMRYNGTKALVSEVEDIRKRMQEVLKRAEGRKDDVARVYDGEAAKNYQTNLQKIAENINTTLTDVTTNLTTEADETYEKYKQQEAKLQQNINIEQ